MAHEVKIAELTDEELLGVLKASRVMAQVQTQLEAITGAYNLSANKTEAACRLDLAKAKVDRIDRQRRTYLHAADLAQDDSPMLAASLRGAAAVFEAQLREAQAEAREAQVTYSAAYGAWLADNGE